jgi:hypothetical protein
MFQDLNDPPELDRSARENLAPRFLPLAEFEFRRCKLTILSCVHDLAEIIADALIGAAQDTEWRARYWPYLAE